LQRASPKSPPLGRASAYITRMARKPRRIYLPRVLGSGQVMMPADLKRLHKYIMEIEHISVISDEVRTVVEEEWPEPAHKLPPKLMTRRRP
jgi:hypothetical protein